MVVIVGSLIMNITNFHNKGKCSISPEGRVFLRGEELTNTDPSKMEVRSSAISLWDTALDQDPSPGSKAMRQAETNALIKLVT